jgi:nicotinamide-nucleotide amidase
MSITAAESLTAGEFQATLGTIPGVSEVFPGGFVTYSETTKAATPVKDRAKSVSAKRKAASAISFAHSSLTTPTLSSSLSFTGVAGPDELEGKPKGTVYIALAQKDGETLISENHFTRDV